MRAFLRLLQRDREPVLHTAMFAEQIGGETFDALKCAGVLVRADPADWYPCGGPDGDGCPRRVVENPGNPEHPYIAICGREPPGCLDVPLTEADLEQTAVSVAGLVRWLRELFDIRGTFELSDTVFPDVLTLGQAEWDGLNRDVFLAFAPSTPAFPTFLALRKKARQGTLVLAPTRRCVPTSLSDLYSPGDRVELLFLEDALKNQNGAIRLNLTESLPSTVREIASPYYSPDRPFCRMFDQNGDRPITESEYRAIQNQADDRDLFIDMTTTIDAGRHPAGRRDLNGTYEETAVTPNEAMLLVTLISARRPMSLHDLRALGPDHPDKIIERARRKADVKLSRYNWRAIHTLRGNGTPELKQYSFNPPVGMSFVVLLPIK
jgi:hypothetical protein